MNLTRSAHHSIRVHSSHRGASCASLSVVQVLNSLTFRDLDPAMALTFVVQVAATRAHTVSH